MIKPVYRATRHVSNLIADAAGHPAAQLGVLILCVAWWALGGSETALASGVSIGSFVLTQMVLNQQRRRERRAGDPCRLVVGTGNPLQPFRVTHLAPRPHERILALIA